MFQDEAGFGRINKPKYCWCKKGIRPSVPCHHIREYRYVYGAVEPISGESRFLIMPYCNTNCMNVFLNHLSMSYPNDVIILVCDGAAWHKAKALIVPVCPPRKNRQKTQAKNRMKRMTNIIQNCSIRPHLFHGSLDNEPLKV